MTATRHDASSGRTRRRDVSIERQQQRRLLAIEGALGRENFMLRVLEPRNSSKAELWRRICTGTYTRPFALDIGKRRQLHFNLNAAQSVMSLSDPSRLVLSYTRKMAAFLLFCRQPEHALILGLGVGSLAKFCYRVLPDCSITVVEVNRDVIQLRGEFGVPDDDHRFRVVHENGQAYVKTLPPGCDVILADACDHAGTAACMTSLDFYHSARACLTRRGVLVANICGPEGACADHLAVLQAAFEGEALVISNRRAGNIIAFCFRDQDIAGRWIPSASSANLLKRETGLNFPRYQRLLAPHRVTARLSGRESARTELRPA